MKATKDHLFHLGVIIGTHGLRGDLKVRSLTEGSDSLSDATEVFLRKPGGQQASHVPVRVAPHKGMMLLRLEGLEHIDQVEGLVGCDVYMRLDELSDPVEDEFYWFQIQGMQVEDSRLGDLGTLEEMFTTPAHDIYVVRGRFGEVLIPAVSQFVREVDVDGARMLVDLPEGLVFEGDEV